MIKNRKRMVRVLLLWAWQMGFSSLLEEKKLFCRFLWSATQRYNGWSVARCSEYLLSPGSAFAWTRTPQLPLLGNFGATSSTSSGNCHSAHKHTNTENILQKHKYRIQIHKKNSIATARQLLALSSTLSGYCHYAQKQTNAERDN